jgi:hypothetical protein
MMIMLFTVLFRNKLRIPLEGTYSYAGRERCDKISGLYPVLRSNYGTASLGASVGSPPGRAIYGRILANAEPFSASVSRFSPSDVSLVLASWGTVFAD